VQCPKVQGVPLASKDVTQPKEALFAAIARLARKKSVLKTTRLNVSRARLGQLHKPVTINALTVQLVNTNRNLAKALAFPVFQVNGTTIPKASQPTIALSVWPVHFHPPTQHLPL
jgi:hypothetical protein